MNNWRREWDSNKCSRVISAMSRSALILTESQRRDPINYQLGQVVEFHRRAKGGFKSGERWVVARRSSETVVAVKDGQEKILPLDQPKSFDLYLPQETMLAAGDVVRIMKNFRKPARPGSETTNCAQ
jgi:hypothetical protein